MEKEEGSYETGQAVAPWSRVSRREGGMVQRSSLSREVQSSVFPDRVSLWGPGCPGTHPGDQDGLQFRDLPASAS